MGYLDAELANQPSLQREDLFVHVIRAVIAIDKTGQWNGLPTKQALKLLAASPDAERWFRATARLVRGEKDAAALFFQGDPPGRYELEQQSFVLRRHGYPVAANVFLAFTLDNRYAAGERDKGVTALAAIPAAQRDTVMSLLDKNMRDRPSFRTAIASRAIYLLLDPHARASIKDLNANPEDYLQVARCFCKGAGPQVLDSIQQLVYLSKHAEAAALCRIVSASYPEDGQVQWRAAKLTAACRDAEGATGLYENAIRLLPEPEKRDVRLDYLVFLKHAEKAAPQADPDPLAAADLLYMAAQHAEAAARYRALLSERALPLRRRLAAWAGLLDTDPGVALKEGGALVDEMAALDATERARLVAWSGGKLWCAVYRTLPVASALRDALPPGPYRSIMEAANWEKESAVMMERLLAADATACLRPGAGPMGKSLRAPAAVLFVLAGRQDQALEILRRPVQWEVSVPQADPAVAKALPALSENRTRTVSSPAPGESERLLLPVLESTADCPGAAVRTPALAATVLNQLTTKPQAGTVDADTLARLFSAAILQTAHALDPPLRQSRRIGVAPLPPADPALFAPVDAAARSALANDDVARSLPLVLRQGLLPALLNAHNPRLQETLFALMMTALDRYAKTAPAGKNPVIEQRDYLITALEGCKEQDMKPFAQRLRQ